MRMQRPLKSTFCESGEGKAYTALSPSSIELLSFRSTVQCTAVAGARVSHFMGLLGQRASGESRGVDVRVLSTHHGGEYECINLSKTA